MLKLNPIESWVFAFGFLDCNQYLSVLLVPSAVKGQTVKRSCRLLPAQTFLSSSLKIEFVLDSICNRRSSEIHELLLRSGRLTSHIAALTYTLIRCPGADAQRFHFANGNVCVLFPDRKLIVSFFQPEFVNDDETPGHDGEVHELLLMGNSLNFHIADTRKYP
jgi:hypothetical protein